MERQEDTETGKARAATRRDVLKAGLTVGLGLGAATLTGVRSTATAQATGGVYGGHVNLLNVGYPEVWDPHLAGTVFALNVGYPEVWDPHLAGTVFALAAVGPISNQVVEFNPIKPTEIIGDLAKRWEVTEGGLVYTFYLHDNIRWWDGKDLTAEDVAFSLQRMIEPGKPRPRVGLLRPYIKTVEAVDRNAVKVTLHYASPAFLQFLAVDYMKILPKHLLTAEVDINVWETIVGSGPFKIKTARRGDSVTFEKNPTYFKPGRPYLDSITILSITDAGTAAAAVKAGKIHMTTGVTSLGVDDLLKLEKN